MFVMYFIHKNLKNMFRPKHVGKNLANFVNKIHNKHRMHFVGYLYIMDSK